jgi:hypothetical protein
MAINKTINLQNVHKCLCSEELNESLVNIFNVFLKIQIVNRKKNSNFYRCKIQIFDRYKIQILTVFHQQTFSDINIEDVATSILMSTYTYTGYT